MPKPLKKAHITVLPNNTYFTHKNWNHTSLNKWITNLGGTLLTTLTDQTTHLLLDEAQWQAQGPHVVNALNQRVEDDGGKKKGKGKGRAKKIKTLSAEWLDEVMMGKKGVKENTFDWTKVDPKSMWKAKDRTGAKDLKKKSSDGTVSGMTTEVLLAEDRYMTEEQKLEAEREKKRIEDARDLRKSELELAKYQRREDLKALIQSRNKVLQNSVFAENWHVYRDATGFFHHVMLTKVDTSTNRNERQALTIQIYESNHAPYQYCLNIQHGATGRPVTNSQTVPRGTNYPTAFRLFKEAFVKFTKIKWEDRLLQLPHAQVREREKDLDFAKKSFQFTPPPVKKVAFVEAAAAPVPIDVDTQSQRDQVAESEVNPQRSMHDFLAGGQEAGPETPSLSSTEPSTTVNTSVSTPNTEEMAEDHIEDHSPFGQEHVSQEHFSQEHINQEYASQEQINEQHTAQNDMQAQYNAHQEATTEEQDMIDAKPNVDDEYVDFGDFGFNLGEGGTVDLTDDNGKSPFDVDEGEDQQAYQQYRQQDDQLDSFSTMGEDDLDKMFPTGEEIAKWSQVNGLPNVEAMAQTPMPFSQDNGGMVDGHHSQYSDEEQQASHEVQYVGGDAKPNVHDKQTTEDDEEIREFDSQFPHTQMALDAAQMLEGEMGAEETEPQQTQQTNEATQMLDHEQSQVSQGHDDAYAFVDEMDTEQTQYPHTQTARDGALRQARQQSASPPASSVLGKRKAAEISADE